MKPKFYQVGGSVRDKFLGVVSKDIDYAVEADSFDAMRAAIIERGGEIFLETPEYFTIRAKVPGHGACDYVLCRKDGAYSDGRHPSTVSVGTIYDDLARRDFTVNAIAIDEEHNLIDPFNGVEDIRYKILRCVGRADERFAEDGLRIIRALRFGITKELARVPDICLYLANRHLFEPRLRGVSGERIREELQRCFQHDTALTLRHFTVYNELAAWLFTSVKDLWLKPTFEKR